MATKRSNSTFGKRFFPYKPRNIASRVIEEEEEEHIYDVPDDGLPDTTTTTTTNIATTLPNTPITAGISKRRASTHHRIARDGGQSSGVVWPVQVPVVDSREPAAAAGKRFEIPLRREIVPKPSLPSLSGGGGGGGNDDDKRYSQEIIKIDGDQLNGEFNLNDKLLKKLSNMLNMNINENYVIIIDNLEANRSTYGNQLYRALEKKKKDVVLLSLNQYIGDTFSNGVSLLEKNLPSCKFDITIVLLSHTFKGSEMLIHSNMNKEVITAKSLVGRILNEIKYKYNNVNCINIIYKSDSSKFQFKQKDEYKYGYEMSIVHDEYRELDGIIEGLIESI